MNLSAAYFDELFAQNNDPWLLQSRWYEQRKRSLLLASLPRRRFRSAFEPGCANGELTLALAERCDHVLAVDISQNALNHVKARSGRGSNITLRCLQIPREWPDEKFDLIVINELAYYLDLYEIKSLVQRVLHSLTPDGVVLGCHWRHPVMNSTLNGDKVHELLKKTLPLAHLVHHCEEDFLLDIWSVDQCSVARKEFLE